MSLNSIKHIKGQYRYQNRCRVNCRSKLVMSGCWEYDYFSRYTRLGFATKFPIMQGIICF